MGAQTGFGASLKRSLVTWVRIPGILGKAASAMRGLKIAVKGLLSSTGIGLIIAFLPEIIDLFKSLYGWVVKTTEGFLELWAAGKKGGFFAQIFRSMVPDAIVKQFRTAQWFNKQMEDYRNLAAEMRRKLDLAAAKKARDLMLIGSKSFDDTVSKLDKLLGHKPETIKASAMLQINKLIGRIAGGKAGAAFRTVGGAGLEGGLTGADIKAAKDAQIRMMFAMRRVREAQEGGKALSGQDQVNLAAAMSRSLVVLKSVMSDEKSIAKIQELGGKTLGALLKQMGPEARKFEAARQIAYGGNKDIATGRGIQSMARMPGGAAALSPFAGGLRDEVPLGQQLYSQEGATAAQPWNQMNAGQAFMQEQPGDKKRREEQRMIENNENLKKLQEQMQGIWQSMQEMAIKGIRLESGEVAKGATLGITGWKLA
jgi:hypothetical protein